ncbi:hypothetical protein [Musicola paradisiaca]|uniref:Uncharacterized protein n=1 Tax=Musicola paradisiaca (strain Ech703) TaxID=579405 RepID=C6CDH9_MUSP7|nr:hypothetical protein [Musicola paradisiaca]ACS85096.1 conserved hypothetical protein [Musicola paradisiaca Ech703]
MTFIDAMHTYFRGEKTEALWFIALAGILLVIFGLVALKAERSGYGWGVAVPAILFGLLLIGVGAGVGLRTDQQVAVIEHSFYQNPSELVQKELPRMQQVNANFRVTFYALGILVAVGLCFHYLAGPEWGRGLGSTLILLGAIGLLIDGFAERRAEPYTAALLQLKANVMVQHADSTATQPADTSPLVKH